MAGHGEESKKLIEKQKLFISLSRNQPGHRLRNSKCILEIGDFIKLGRVEMVVL